MKHKRSIISIAMAALVLVSLCAVSASVSAAPSSANVQAPALVGAPIAPGSGPATCLLKVNDHIYIFVKGSDGALWYKDTSSALGWTSLGGYLTSSPAATSQGNFIIVYVRGGDGALWSRGTTNGGTPWSNWGSLGGQLLAGTGPGASSYTDNSLSTVLELFVTGTNHALYQYQGTSWEKLGGYLTSSPAAASLSNGLTDVYVRGGDGALWSRHFSGTVWDSWNKIGGQIAPNTGPGACSYGSGREDVFVEGMNGALYQVTWGLGGPPFGSWQNLGGVLTSSPGAVTDTVNGHIYISVQVRGNDGFRYTKDYYSPGPNDPGKWYGWGGPHNGPP